MIKWKQNDFRATGKGIHVNIRTYKGDFSYAIFQRGQIYFRQKKLKEVIRDVKGNYRFIVEGTKNYNVTASITPEGELSGLSCDCPYDRGYCKHLAAALIYLESIYDKQYRTAVQITPGDLSGTIPKEPLLTRRNTEYGLFRSLKQRSRGLSTH